MFSDSGICLHLEEEFVGEGVVIMEDFLEVMMIIVVKEDPEDT